MSNNSVTKQQRRQRKAGLEARIEQQRIDMLLDASRWREASQGIDHYWFAIQRYKAPIYALGGFLMLRGAKRPRSLLRLGKRAMAGFLLFKRARRLLS